jgi:hypothetical protein
MLASCMTPRLQSAFSRSTFSWIVGFLITVAVSGVNAQEDNELPITQSAYLDDRITRVLQEYEISGQPEATVISDVVIEPSRLFISLPWYWNQLRSDRSKFYWQDLDLRLKYLGDDYGFPVMGLALVKVTEKTGRTREKIRDFWVARAIRSPLPEDGFDRPRNRGRNAVNLYEELRAKNPDMKPRELISSIPFEYLETNSAECPELTAVLSKLFDVPLVSSNQEFFPLHSDTIVLTIRNGPGYRRITYEGWVEADGNTPGAWAVNLIAAIDSCWRAVPVEQFDQFEIPE